MRYRPEETVFSPTTDCRLDCPHCGITKSKKTLSAKVAIKFIRDCARSGIKRVGFTGGEPFLALDFLEAVIKEAVNNGLVFGRITTSGAAFVDRADLINNLSRLKSAGYDGSFAVSVDAFHRQDMRKAALFIKNVLSIWRRPDIVSIVSVNGAREYATEEKLKALANYLKARPIGFGTKYPAIRSKEAFIKIQSIDLSPIGRASVLKDPWDGRWFKDDHCNGPGNIFFVMPNGDVKPCCGYATEADTLTIGNIRRDSVKALIKNAHRNRFVRAVFESGLGAVRKQLEARGVVFPGKTSNHCFFCHYILTHASPRILDKCLS